jgi:hypothetical protein
MAKLSINEKEVIIYLIDGNNYNQRLAVHPLNSICRTIIGQGHAGMEPKVLIVRRSNESEKNSENNS